MGAIFRRVKWLLDAGTVLPMPSYPLSQLLTGSFSARKGVSDELMELYLQLDDHDVFLSLKQWAKASDPVLADLCTRFLNRSLFRTTFLPQAEMEQAYEDLKQRTRQYLASRGMPEDDETIACYLHSDRSYSEAYKYRQEQLWILDDGKAVEFSKAVDAQHIMALSKPVIKPYLVHLKEI